MCKHSANWILTIFLILAVYNGLTHSLRNVVLTGGGAVRSGGRVTLRCSYDLEGAQLYSIRWHVNEDEFYRFVPKESPPAMVFSLPGVHVDLSASNDQEVTLTGVHRQLAGEYHCEVSADAPLFHTVIQSTSLEIVDVPEFPPSLTVDRTSYSAGDSIKANCSSLSSYPGANITWYINGQPINKTFTVTIPENPDIWETSSSFSVIEISTEEELQHPKYQVGGNQQETFSGQLKVPSSYPEVSVYTAYFSHPIDESIKGFHGSNGEYGKAQELKEAAQNAYDEDKIESFDPLPRVYPTKPSIIPLKVTRVRLQLNYVGDIKIKCLATIYNVYKDFSVEKEVKEWTPHIAQVMGQSSAGWSHQVNTHQRLLQCLSICGLLFVPFLQNVLVAKR